MFRGCFHIQKDMPMENLLNYGAINYTNLGSHSFIPSFHLTYPLLFLLNRAPTAKEQLSLR